MNEPSDAEVRRAAQRKGLQALKGRGYVKLRGEPEFTADDQGGYKLVDPDSGVVIAGKNFELSGSEVMEVLARFSK